MSDLCQRQGAVTSASLAKALGISRQAAHRKLVTAVRAGTLVTEGAARSTRYRPATPTCRFPIAGSAEDDLLARVEARTPSFADLSEAERAIAVYLFAELVNNALEHSRGSEVAIRLQIKPTQVVLVVEDDGIGAFASVREALDLASNVEAAVELTKGKVTTMPLQHTGEGIFFTAKIADRFELAANGVHLIVDTLGGDVAVLEADETRGTRVEARFARPPARSARDVFEAHTEDFEFTKTRTIVRLFALGRDFVSRSEARRLLRGLEAFREVIVDFTGVRGIGQGFADEVFRVFAREHPETRLLPIHMNEAVRFFVERAERARRQK